MFAVIHVNCRGDVTECLSDWQLMIFRTYRRALSLFDTVATFDKYIKPKGNLQSFQAKLNVGLNIIP